jgi:hypothetical protein
MALRVAIGLFIIYLCFGARLHNCDSVFNDKERIPDIKNHHSSDNDQKETTFQEEYAIGQNGPTTDDLTLQEPHASDQNGSTDDKLTLQEANPSTLHGYELKAALSRIGRQWFERQLATTSSKTDTITATEQEPHNKISIIWKQQSKWSAKLYRKSCKKQFNACKIGCNLHLSANFHHAHRRRHGHHHHHPSSPKVTIEDRVTNADHVTNAEHVTNADRLTNAEHVTSANHARAYNSCRRTCRTYVMAVCQIRIRQ